MKNPRETAQRRARSGTTIFILFIAVTVLFILGFSFSYVLGQRRRIIMKHGEDFTAYYMAQAGVRKALWVLRNAFTEDLVTPKNPQPKEPLETNVLLLNLLDMERAREWARTVDLPEGELIPDGSAHVLMEFLNVSRNEFSTYIDRVERIPPGLEQYREKRRPPRGRPSSASSPSADGRASCASSPPGVYRGTRRIIEVIKDVKVTDITPPAPDHSLFIHGKNTEYLKGDRQVPALQSRSSPGHPRPHPRAGHEGQRGAPSRARRVEGPGFWHERVEDQRVPHHEVRRGGHLGGPQDRARPGAARQRREHPGHGGQHHPEPESRGTGAGCAPTASSTSILPFFEADDIINYFADTSIFGHQRPEVGYLFNQYRLHDPYLSVYTHYEGYVYKNYRRLNPLALGPSKEPQPVPPQRYTINTRMNYVQRHPDRAEVPGLEFGCVKHGKKYCHRLHKTPETLWGRQGRSHRPRGNLVLPGEAHHRRPLRGPGAHRLREGHHTWWPVSPRRRRTPPWDSFPSTGPSSSPPRRSASASKRDSTGFNGFTGTPMPRTLDILGNLACETFNREKQPGYVTCRFDPDAEEPHVRQHHRRGGTRHPRVAGDRRGRAAQASVRPGVETALPSVRSPSTRDGVVGT